MSSRVTTRCKIHFSEGLNALLTRCRILYSIHLNVKGQSSQQRQTDFSWQPVSLLFLLFAKAGQPNWVFSLDFSLQSKWRSSLSLSVNSQQILVWRTHTGVRLLMLFNLQISYTSCLLANVQSPNYSSTASAIFFNNILRWKRKILKCCLSQTRGTHEKSTGKIFIRSIILQLHGQKTEAAAGWKCILHQFNTHRFTIFHLQ